MRTVVTSIFLTLFALGAAAQGTLAVEVVLSEPAKGGTLRLVLCPNASAFASEQGCILEQVHVTGPIVVITRTDLTVGRYAIKAFHDVNDNGKLDTNWIGIPSEPYGFSNDAMGTFGPPSFEQAGFVVKTGANTVRFRMKG
ncbi:MAG: DUF2141 domain-containing protein [Flavobacteriales bacterium]